MSELAIYRDDAPDVVEVHHTAAGAIAAALLPIAVMFERWDSPVALDPQAAPETILEAYRPYLDQLMGQTGAGSADVLKLTPDHPQAAALRRKFLAEHRHSEPEIRFFVRGSAHFILHVEGRVYDVTCTQGDLIGLPAGIAHWFDAGARPDFTTLRVFTDEAGWVAHYTGDSISERFAVAA